ncbi:hypothetical protein [Comamonas antarctica]|uniref:WD40/YVTN/BNR-like repeat-containing protein n=1 Tax=Comamonas antarctica TaxID=2743470 RepID=UPI0028EE0B36|nr:hypothetical protein [Comamonas antarctica]
MPAARHWRAVGFTAIAGGDLELSALHPHGPRGREVGVLSSTIAPSVGTLANLSDDSSATSARFAARTVSAAGFALQWDFGEAVVLYGFRTAAPTRATALRSLVLQYSTDGVTWGPAAQLGEFPYPGTNVLSAAPTSEPPFAATPGAWVAREASGLRDWSTVAMSADATIQLAAAPGNYIYVTKDAGATWVAQDGPGARNWFNVAISDSGQVMLAAHTGTGGVFVSRDAGNTWAQVIPEVGTTWYGCAMSADGQTMLVAGYGSRLHRSIDAGETWTPLSAAGTRSWYSVGVSGDGSRMLAGVNGGYLYASDDGGATWSAQMTDVDRTWYTARVSADGRSRLAAGYNTYVFTSSEGSDTWVQQTGLGFRSWCGSAISADGSRILVGAEARSPYLSNDGGGTWVLQTALPTGTWRALAITPSGMQATGGAYPLNLYSWQAREAIYTEPAAQVLPLRQPAFFATAPIPPWSVSKLPAPIAFRDFEFGGRGRIFGTVKEKGTPVNVPLRRRVRLVRESDNALVRETWSNAATGEYSFTGIAERYTYSVISYDHLANYRAVISDRLTPEVT